MPESAISTPKSRRRASACLTIARGTLSLALFGPQGYGARTGLLARPVLITQACDPIAAASFGSFGASVLLGVMCGFLLLCFIATWRPADYVKKVNHDDGPVDAAAI